jgi:sortase A
MTQMVGTPTGAGPNPYRASGPTRRQRRAARLERARVITRSIGEGFITMGIVILLFCVYQLFWTNISADHQANVITAQVQKEFIIPVAPPVQGQPVVQKPVAYGQGYGLVYIPRLGKGWVKPLVEGESLDNLKKGVVHYTGNAQPGEIGNFAIAGHRATNGEPFRNLDRMQPGDVVVVETANFWVTYRINRTIIVKPTDTWVLDPVPGKPGATPTEATLTMTTCNPRWASFQRMIVFGTMVDKRTKAQGPPAGITAKA